MVSPLWIWLPEIESGAELALPSDEAKHVVSRRLHEGDELVVFDAKGHRALARLVSVARRAVRVQVGTVDFEASATGGLCVASAIPKGDRLSVLLHMATQLGLFVWQPLLLEDSAVRKLDVDSPRLRRLGVEACKVARRPWAMEVRPPLRLHEALDSCETDARVVYGDREGEAVIDGQAGRRPDWVFIGPEAGFRDSEIEALRAAGASAVTFGAFNLRIETAVVAAASILGLSRASVEADRDRKISRGGLEDGER